MKTQRNNRTSRGLPNTNGSVAITFCFVTTFPLFCCCCSAILSTVCLTLALATVLTIVSTCEFCDCSPRLSSNRSWFCTCNCFRFYSAGAQTSTLRPLRSHHPFFNLFYSSSVWYIHSFNSIALYALLGVTIL